jgi:hypothetical protein
MSAINLTLWLAGLALQALLVILLVVRRLASSNMLFTLLIVFYILRSVLLFTLFGHVQSGGYQQLYSLLSLADLLLQMMIATQLAVGILKQTGDWRLQHGPKIMAIFGFGLVAAAAIAASLPEHGRVPVDRGAAFVSVLMLLLFFWMLLARVSSVLRSIAAGFAVFGITGVVAGMVRNNAALYRDPAAYTAASYAQAGIYMAVVLFWIFALRLDQQSFLNAAAKPTITADAADPARP